MCPQNEIEAMDEIRKHTTLDGSLDMDEWHSPCGITHCLAGWAQVLFDPNWDAVASQEETIDSIGQFTKVFASELLPSFVDLFYVSTSHMHNYLKYRVYKLAEGEVQLTGIGWMDNRANVSTRGNDREAVKALASNQRCVGCMDCMKCRDCINCDHCVNCIGLESSECTINWAYNEKS